MKVSMRKNIKIIDASPEHILNIKEGCSECILRKISICDMVTKSELNLLEDLSSNVYFSKNVNLFHLGDQSNFVYTITSGIARIVVHLKDGRRQILGFLLPGDFIGLSLEPEWNFSVEAVTPISACQFSRLQFKQFMSKNLNGPSKIQDLSRNEIEELYKLIVILGVMNAEEKLMKFILMQKKRWDYINSTISDIVPINMTRQDIANYLGMTIETVSRSFSTLEKKKLIIIKIHAVKIL